MNQDILSKIVDEIFSVIEASPLVKGHFVAELAVKFVHGIVLNLLPVILNSLKSKGVA